MSAKNVQERLRSDRRNGSRRGRAALAVLGLCLSAPAALAQSKPEPKPSSAFDEPFFPMRDERSPLEIDQAVKEHMQAGAEALRKGNLDGALAELMKAWELRRLAAVAASLAHVETKLGRYRDAAEHWDYVLRNLPADSDAVRARAEAQLAECRKHVGSIRITVDTPGALIVVDDRVIDAAPLDRDVWLDPGEHVVFARLNGRASERTTVSVSAGERRTIALELGAPPPAAPTVAMDRREPLSSAPVRVAQTDRGIEARAVVVIGGVVLTLVAGAVGIVYTARADTADDEISRLKGAIEQKGDQSLPLNGRCVPSAVTPPAECGELGPKLDEYVSARNTATAAFVTAGVLGAATAGAFLLWPDARPANRGRLSVAPLQLGRARGVLVTTSF